MLLLAAFCNDLVDELDDGLVNIMSHVDSLKHTCLGDLISSCLDHDDLLLC